MTFLEAVKNMIQLDTSTVKYCGGEKIQKYLFIKSRTATELRFGTLEKLPLLTISINGMHN